MQRIHCHTLLLAVTLFGMAASVSAQTIYATSFENPRFANGSVLVGQDGWIAPDFLSPNAAHISRAAARRGKQGLLVRGLDIVGNDIVNPPFGAVGSYRRAVNYVANGATTVVSADVQVDGPRSGEGPTDPFFGATVALRVGGPNGANTYEFQLSSDGVFYGVDDNLLGGPAVGDPGVLPRTKAHLSHWYRMSIAADFTAKTITYGVNGHALGTISLDDPTYDTLLRGSLVVYSSPNVATFSRNVYAAKFDDFEITLAHNRDDGGGDD